MVEMKLEKKHIAFGALAHYPGFANIFAILLLAGLGVLIWLFVINPYFRLVENLEINIEEKTRNLARVSAIVDRTQNQDTGIATELAAVTQADFLSGDDLSLVLADLQTRVGQVVSSNKGTLVQTRQLESVKENDVIKSGLSVQFRGEIKDVYKILYELESRQPFLFIEKAQIQLFGDHANRRLVSGIIPAQLQVEIEIVGYLQPGKSDTQ